MQHQISNLINKSIYELLSFVCDFGQYLFAPFITHMCTILQTFLCACLLCIYAALFSAGSNLSIVDPFYFILVSIFVSLVAISGNSSFCNGDYFFSH